MHQDPSDDASIPTKKYVVNAQIVEGGTRRKVANRTRPLVVKEYVVNAQIVEGGTRRKVANRTRPLFKPPVAVENPTLATLEDEDLSTAKKPRLQAPTSFFHLQQMESYMGTQPTQ
jgi:hypothetical protein